MYAQLPSCNAAGSPQFRFRLSDGAQVEAGVFVRLVRGGDDAVAAGLQTVAVTHLPTYAHGTVVEREHCVVGGVGGGCGVGVDDGGGDYVSQTVQYTSY